MASYTKELWSRIKYDWETGDYSYRELYLKYTDTDGKSPSEIAMKKRSLREGWKKGRQKAIIEKKIQETNLEMFTRLGMPTEKVFQKVICGMSVGEEAYEKLAAYFADSKSPLAPEFSELLRGYFRDWNTVHKFIDTWAKLTGTFAPTQKELSGRNGKPLVPESAVSQMDDDELAAKIAEAVKGAKNAHKR